MILLFFSLASAIKTESPKSDSTTIYWSPPGQNYFQAEATYRLYYKAFEDRDKNSPWIFLTSTADTEVIVKSRQTGPGSFIFGVTYLADGKESAMHTSLDSTAIPAEGWYLFWGDVPTWISYKAEMKQAAERRQLAGFNLKGQTLNSPPALRSSAVFVSAKDNKLANAKKSAFIER